MNSPDEPAFPGYIRNPLAVGAPDIPTKGLSVRELAALTIYANRVGEASGGNAQDVAHSCFQQADSFLRQMQLERGRS